MGNSPNPLKVYLYSLVGTLRPLSAIISQEMNLCFCLSIFLKYFFTRGVTRLVIRKDKTQAYSDPPFADTRAQATSSTAYPYRPSARKRLLSCCVRVDTVTVWFLEKKATTIFTIYSRAQKALLKDDRVEEKAKSSAAATPADGHTSPH